jgi:tetratricopeptide (TPR) repeat protein
MDLVGHLHESLARLERLGGFRPRRRSDVRLGLGAQRVVQRVHRPARYCDRPNANRLTGIGCAHFDAGRYEQAVLYKHKALHEELETAWINRTLSIAYARMGDRLAALDSVEALRRYSPDLTIGHVVSALPFRRNFLDRVADGLDDLGVSP